MRCVVRSDADGIMLNDMLLNILTRLPRKSKRLIMLASDALLLPLALWTAIVLRRGDLFYPLADKLPAFIIAPLVAIPVLIKLGLYKAVIRYMEERVALTVINGVTLSVLLLVVLNSLFGVSISASSYAIYWLIAVLYIYGSRILVRMIFNRLDKPLARQHVLIYGAGETGRKLTAALRAGTHFKVVAYIDDKEDIWHSEVGGVMVYPPQEIAELIEESGIGSILLAIPSATRKRRSEVIRELGQFRVLVKTIPNLHDLVSGFARIDEIREVEIEDLLGRDAVQPVAQLLERCIRGKSVMVTGAGGSIGSELCRQILMQRPSRLVLFEMTEFALYQIEQELNAANLAINGCVEIVSVLGSVMHQHRVEKVLETYSVQTVYHAAAYKHVPLVEHNMFEGVLNNVFGTWRTADAAKKSGVETFVLISTDKAVRPTNVMGASKRFAELVLQAYSREGGGTRYCMVRFGNVLGSSGSVVPLFKKQIEQGGPVTVTHPEITRYFMTIPEAAALVLQAGAMGQGGDVFVLDMGVPVKIVELARKMIHLSGLEVRDASNPDGDIEIQFSGLRPGEKLYEELLIGGNVSGTMHPLIMRAEEVELPWQLLQEKLEQTSEAARRFDCEAIRRILMEVVDGYHPTGGICDHIWKRSPATDGSPD